MYKRLILSKSTVQKEHMVKYKTVNSNKVKTILLLSSIRILIRFPTKESLSLIFSDVLINFTTFNLLIQRGKIMPLPEYISKDFPTDYLKYPINMHLIFNRDLLLKPKIL